MMKFLLKNDGFHTIHDDLWLQSAPGSLTTAVQVSVQQKNLHFP